MRLWRSLSSGLALALVLSLTNAIPSQADADFCMSPETALSHIAETPDLVIVDVRTPQEFAEGHLKGALNIPVDELEKRLNDVPSGRPTLLYCRRGVRAERAYHILRDHRPDVAPLHIVKGKVEDLLP